MYRITIENGIEVEFNEEEFISEEDNYIKFTIDEDSIALEDINVDMIVERFVGSRDNVSEDGIRLIKKRIVNFTDYEVQIPNPKAQ